MFCFSIPLHNNYKYFEGENYLLTLYWSGSLDEGEPCVACALYLDSDLCEMEEGDAVRCYGLSVRPVRSAR